MTSEFVRKYYIYKIIRNPYNFGITNTDKYVSSKNIISTLNNLYRNNSDNIFFSKFYDISEKTIKRDIEEIKTFFSIEINRKRNYGFYIDEKIFDKTHQLIFDKMELFLAYNKEKEWSPYITTEKSSLQTDKVNLIQLINAIEQKLYINIKYKGWYDDNIFQNINTKVQPLHIREINKAWYLIAYNKNIGIYTFCLDERIENLLVTSVKVEKPINFDVKKYFKDCFGILKKDDLKPLRIVLKVANHHFKYVLSKPIHQSQKILSYPKKMETKNLDYLDKDIWGTVEVFVQPNFEFIMEVLRYNVWIYATEPKEFVDLLASHMNYSLKNFYPTAEFFDISY